MTHAMVPGIYYVTLECGNRNGVGEIRTHGTVSGSAVFKTAPINHSATTPEAVN